MNGWRKLTPLLRHLACGCLSALPFGEGGRPPPGGGSTSGASPRATSLLYYSRSPFDNDIHKLF